MIVPAHIGIDHPDLVWLGAAALLAFAAGLGIGLHRSRRSDPGDDHIVSPDEDVE